ncbi:methionine adenosyltransferase [Natronogracilivirga saccharolytica]|uniref:S-adenosylmethionine synthase n=1 Tax=Natronogracilivirga saccharolytica TaxID=2812953 RepID=A0A8J7RJ01_9BACT|nr:methionine adenosyltransferase [Natronogracilivirga saccharolytica]MBP3191595.1 methionine adenosyltransferase [Natronogracilivirga saccharolytica]
MKKLFTSESVSEGHPDKVCDQISDAILDAMLEQDPDSRVAVETLVTTGLVVVSGEVTTKAYVDIQELVRDVIREIGYTKPGYRFDAESCGVMVTIHQQSPDIAMGVDKLGAGDQGMMFGFATKETDTLMPMSLQYSHNLVRELAEIRKKTDLMPYLRPDSKSQVTVEYDENNHPLRVHTIVVSTQHDDDITQDKIKEDIRKHLIPRAIPGNLVDDETIIHVNPTGNFVIGGPHGDTGLTGRKIIVDTYGGHGAHGGGAFSGKDASKVDRSAAYAARHIAKNIVAADLADECLIQLAYAIGIAEPVSISVDTFGTGKISDVKLTKLIRDNFDCTPEGIINRFGLKRPIFKKSAAYGHFGRDEFPWEKLDYVDKLKAQAAS